MMKWTFGGYAAAANETLASPMSFTRLETPTGVLWGLEIVASITGRVKSSTQSGLITRIADLKTAEKAVGSDFEYVTNDDVPTGLSVLNSQTMAGLTMSELRFAQRLPGEMGLFADYELKIAGIIDVNTGGNPVVAFEETFVSTNPVSGGEFVMVPIFGDSPQKHETFQTLPTQCVQSGVVTFLKRPPSNWPTYIPAPLSSGDVHNSQTRLEPLKPQYTKNGQYFLWPIAYSYVMESAFPLPLQLMLPSVGV